MEKLEIVVFDSNDVEVFNGDTLICKIDYDRKVVLLSSLNGEFPILPLLKTEKESFKIDQDLRSNYNQSMFRRIGARIQNYHFN